MSLTTALHDGPLSLRDRKKKRIRAELIDAALTSFDTWGYSATRVEDIATAAVVSRGTFFNYFSSKEGIVLAWAADLQEALMTASDAGRAAHDPPPVLLRTLAEIILHATTPHPVAIRALIGALHAPDEERVAGAQAALDLNGLITPIIVVGQEASEFRADIAAEILGAFVANTLLLQLAWGGNRTGTTALDDVMTLLLAALRPPVQ